MRTSSTIQPFNILLLILAGTAIGLTFGAPLVYAWFEHAAAFPDGFIALPMRLLFDVAAFFGLAGA